MRDNMYEGTWSPFDPKWYREAFDKYISTADQLFNRDLIIQQGYHLPDADGSRSSVFRNNAVLNNSFNEKKLREALKDIYFNNSHKLIASNHDNTHFFQWQGYMSDMTYIPNTNVCQIVIPTDTFIGPKERDQYKLSQFYRKWIKVEDILNNWDIFKWHCMLFIDQKVYSEYELRIDDHEVTIRFKYYDYWVRQNHMLYVYKFDTNAQCRIRISRELCDNQWNWKIPTTYLSDKRVINSSNIMVAINKISDPAIRSDGLERIEVLGDNLEFLKIEDGYIDISRISDFNKTYIHSEATEWLWMSIVVPKFFHEYPIILPTDVVFRPYEANFQKVVTMDHDRIQHVKTTVEDGGEYKQLYVDLNGHLKDVQNGWNQMIRPIVLADAFDNPYVEPSDDYQTELGNLRDLTVKGADLVEEFRFFILDYTTDEKFNQYLDSIVNIMHSIHDEHNAFLDKVRIETNDEYERLFKKFLMVVDTIKEDGISSEWFTESEEGTERDFWLFISPLIHIPRELADKFGFVNVIHSMGDNKILWDEIDGNLGTVRFQRPIDERDFWTFEYDPDDKVWRPYQLTISRRFPDVYLLKDPKEENPTLNRIFKAFFFYSDTMNVLNESNDIVRATPTWDEDMQEYELSGGAVYRDIFMEKFYWMGVRSIYGGILKSKCRWEAIEYVIDNNSYNRFNELFLKTMDPYFKLGLATYLKSDNYEFPFDDAVSKMQEAVSTKFRDYKRITNFEVYLNKSWIPSYFDYVTKIVDSWDYGDRLLKRPRNTFDVNRLLPILLEIQIDVMKAVKSLIEDIDWILEKLAIENYHLDVDLIKQLRSVASEMDENISGTLKFTKELDLQIYSINDVNHIIDGLKHHNELVSTVADLLADILHNTENHDVYELKREILQSIIVHIDELPNYISKISAMVQNFDMEGFMKAINDLRSYFDHAKTNPDDNSLIGYINKFDDPWSVSVKEQRNQLFSATAVLYGSFEPLKSYDVEEVASFVNMVTDVKDGISSLRKTISRFWDVMGYAEDLDVINKLDHTEEFINKFVASITEYMGSREEMLGEFDSIFDLLDQMRRYNISDTEVEYENGIKNGLDHMLQALSYIAGKNNKDEALRALSDIKTYILSWKTFIDIEEEVFQRIYKLSKPPIEFLNTLETHAEIINTMIDYMNTVNIPFVPDKSWPTYSDIYSIEKIEIVSGGFRHQVGEVVFVPNLGSYKITSVSGTTAAAKAIENMGYRNTTLRNLVNTTCIYDTTTNGIGLGITVKALSSKHIRILNDEVVQPILLLVQNSIYLVKKDVQNPNPYNNSTLQVVLRGIESTKNHWDSIVDVYREYMSDDMDNTVSSIVNLTTSLIPLTETFIITRSKIDLAGFIESFDAFIASYYHLFQELDKMDENFYYYDNNCRVERDKLLNYYDDGSTWSDATLLKIMAKDAEINIKLFKHKLLNELESSNNADQVMSLCDDLISKIEDICRTIDELPYAVIDINSTIRQIETRIQNMPADFRKDIWYRFNDVTVADAGRDYQVGDIVEIIPQLPLDKNGEPIHDMEDIVMNDVILLQVTEVDCGRVSKIQPLMNYALPYLLWGIRETKTRVGDGHGLTVDAYSYEIQLSDSTLFDSKDSDVSLLPQFDENDMFMFKFENIHDLNIAYDVFIGGKQITNFFQRHETVSNPMHPKEIDVIYVNANEVMSLQNSSITIPAEHHFIYKLDKINVVDPGAGYAVGQEIFVDVGQMTLKLKVSKLTDGPTKGILDAEMSSWKLMEETESPSCENALVATDSLNNIDDEFNVGYYDNLTKDGIIKPATISLDPELYQFESRRFDNLEDGDRNKVYMYPDVDMPLTDAAATDGDPDYHWYQGSRINNSQHPMEDSREWNGIMNIVPPTDPFIPDCMRIPTNKPVKGEYQNFGRIRIHNSNPEEALEGQTVSSDIAAVFDFTIKNAAMVNGDLQVNNFKDLPKHVVDWPQGGVGKIVIVASDETNGGQRMMYKIRTFVAAGFFVYELPEPANQKWNIIDVDWMNCDFYPDYPSIKSQYPSAPWRTSKDYTTIQHGITDGKYPQKYIPEKKHHASFIRDLILDDLSIWNWNTHSWENLHDSNRWKLEVRNDDANKDWGFRLTFLQEGLYSYDMQLFWNKIPETQMRNAAMKRNAVLDIIATIAGEVNRPAVNMSVNTSRHFRIRKLFPYEQRETFIIGKDLDGGPLGYEMNFKLAPYIHFKNELHLEDIKIYNKSAGRFENVLDRQLFEVRFRDDKAVARGYETQTRIVQSIIGNSGHGFIDGNAWAWNEEFNIHVFGYVTADFKTDGHLLTFEAMHCPNPPEQDISLEFQVYQNNGQDAVVMMEFLTEKVEVYGDGYIHNVSNRLAPLPQEFKIIAQYNLDTPTEYEVIISKTPRKWTFVEPKWMMSPTFILDDYNIQQDRIYVLTDHGRYPLVNPSTGKPTIQVIETENGTSVTFLNLYRRYERLDICTTPYPMRSVYVQRRIPSHGFIDLKGKINKPLNKKYFEFWVNGRLLYDEVTIITPTKIVLHGLRSLKNLEIIEINRDPNEFFSDTFLNTKLSDYSDPIQSWDYETYLDAALEGTLDGDNYTPEEQEYLLSPVWKQVSQDHPEFKNYPPNVDIEDDVLVRANPDDHPIKDLEDPTYQFMIIDAPTLEGHPIVERNLTFEHFGFTPMTESMIIDIMNEEWSQEIEEDPYFPEHSVMTDDEWYGMATRLYDEYGILVHTLNESAYKVSDDNLLRINVDKKLSRIVKNQVSYDLT